VVALNASSICQIQFCTGDYADKYTSVSKTLWCNACILCYIRIVCHFVTFKRCRCNLCHDLCRLERSPEVFETKHTVRTNQIYDDQTPTLASNDALSMHEQSALSTMKGRQQCGPRFARTVHLWRKQDNLSPAERFAAQRVTVAWYQNVNSYKYYSSSKNFQ